MLGESRVRWIKVQKLYFTVPPSFFRICFVFSSEARRLLGERDIVFLTVFDSKHKISVPFKSFRDDQTVNDIGITIFTRHPRSMEKDFSHIYQLWRLQSTIHNKPKIFENGVLFQRLGLPFTMIRHENRTFRKRSSQWTISKRRVFVFAFTEKNVSKTDLPKNDSITAR